MAFKIAFFVLACSIVVVWGASIDSRFKRQSNNTSNATQNLANALAESITYQANNVQNSLDSVNDLIKQKSETCANITRTFVDLLFAFPRFKLTLLGAGRNNTNRN